MGRRKNGVRDTARKRENEKIKSKGERIKKKREM